LDNILLMILLQLALIALNAVFACAEIAVIQFNDNKLARMAESGDKRAMQLSRLTDQPARFLATIQVAITLSGFLGSAFAAENFSDPIVQGLLNLGLPLSESALHSIVVILITIILSYFTLVFGELVPKRVAMRKAEKLALGMAGMISAISKVFAPLVSLLTASTNLVLRLMGIDPNEEDEEVSEEEIRMMVDVGSETGAIDDDEKEFIQNVFEFDDITAGEIVTHRTDITVLFTEESDEAWKSTIYESRYTLYPVCEDSADNIIGILHAKEYLRLEDKSREAVMAKAVKPPYYVPENVRADILFRNMKASRNRLAVVLDEYGGLCGIVTMNDLVELLVGDLGDDDNPEDKDDESIEQTGERTWKIAGRADLEEVEKQLGIDLPDEDHETFNGYIFSILGTVPQDGTTMDVETELMRVHITDILDHQIESAVVEVKEQPKSEE